MNLLLMHKILKIVFYNSNHFKELVGKYFISFGFFSKAIYIHVEEFINKYYNTN